MNTNNGVSDLQKKAWDTVSKGWKKWNDFTMNYDKPFFAATSLK
ncbi:MAG TPA: hypothetical protein VJ765_17740 [Chitinophagaceae bacterium]|nr:hypothetical protein [Chitinophagaceae bacterium]